MTDKEFWEDDPQLYWSYLILYKKKIEFEEERMKYNCWLQGKMNCMAYSVAIANCFGKDKKVDYPSYEEFFGNKQEKTKTPEEIDNYVQSVNNAWARF